MQIHELTTKQPLTEAGLGDYLKAALSTDPAIVAMHNNPNVSLAQRAQAIGRNKQIDQIAKKAYDSWNQNYLQLVKSNGNQPLSAPEYADELEAFVQKNLMPAYTPMAGVSNAPQLQQAIQTAAASASNPKALAGAFNQLVDLAAVARELPQGRQRARAANQAAQMVTPGATQTPAAPATNYNIPAYQRKQQAPAAAAQTAQQSALTDTPTEVTPTEPAINPDGSITVAGAQGEKPSKIYPTDPMYPSLAAAIAKTAQQSAPDRSPEEIEKYRTNAVNQISGQNKLSMKDAEGRVGALLKKGTFSPRDVQAWARSLPPGNIPNKPYPPGEYPAVNMMVNKLLGLA